MDDNAADLAAYFASLDAPIAPKPAKATSKPPRAETQWHVYYSHAYLADRFLASNPTVRFVSPYAHWRSYDADTGVWNRVLEPHVRDHVMRFLRSEHDAALMSDTKEQAQAASSLLKVQTARDVLAVAQSRLLMDQSRFDKWADHVVVANGMLDLRTATLMPFDADAYFTQRIDVAYDPSATHEGCDAVLDCLPGDALDQMQIMAGQALTAHQPSRPSVFFFFGKGANGKSSFINLLQKTAGQYGDLGAKQMLLRGGSSSNFHSIKVKNKRQIYFEELPEERFLDGGAIRDLAGTLMMSGEHKGQDVETFENFATVFVTLNELPQVSETVHGVWRRLKLIDFPYTYRTNPSEVVSDTDRLAVDNIDKLAKTDARVAEAFLAWRVEGARRWYENGMRDPVDASSVTQAVRQWRGTNDPLADFFAETLELSPR